MAMTARNFKYIGSVAVSNTVPSILDGFYTLFTSTTYYDASARSPGSGIAWTGTQHQVTGTTECIDLAPVSSSHGVRYLLSGSASARTPTMVTSPFSDTWSTNIILHGTARSWNTYNSTGNGWDQALPGSTGSSFTGFCRAFATSSLTATRVHAWECSDGVMLQIQQSTGTSMLGFGLDIDPLTTYSDSPTCAEDTTGGRYLLWNTSLTTACSTIMNSTANSSTVAPYGTSQSNGSHCYALSVSGVNLTAISKLWNLTNITTTTSCINDDGDWMPIPIVMGVTSGNTPYGILREIRIGPDRKIGDTFSLSGVVKGYAYGTHPSSDNDTLWLMA